MSARVPVHKRLPPSVRAEAQRILDREARRVLSERLERATPTPQRKRRQSPASSILKLRA